MLSYSVDGKVIRLTVAGDVSLSERESVFSAIRADAAIIDGFVVLVDARDAKVTFRDASIDDRTQALVDSLGPKFGGACAFIEPADDPLYGKRFQRAGAKIGLRVGLFADEPSALRWLGVYIEGEQA